ncbi:serine/threonine-protein kinase [Streptomyces sp. NPDC049949]|uniref:serine/threonine-protein kinase n=1 Tax=Streptomyces sp. NPDC049949 TaxID=3154627 RepID=UPI003414CAEA
MTAGYGTTLRSTGSGVRARFRREVEAAKAVGGFWTATVVDADPEAETPWVASDYIPAPNLAERVAQSGPLPEDAVWRLGAGMAEALHSVHRAGLVHRDPKPANGLLTENGPRLIDFGIAKALNGATMLTRTGVAIGTAGFMSPEQAQGGGVGTASDVFSLGTVLCFAVTGRMPFGEGSAAQLLYRVVHETPSLEHVPEGLRAVLGGCLEKRAERRPSAEELLSALSGGGAVTVAPSRPCSPRSSRSGWPCTPSWNIPSPPRWRASSRSRCSAREGRPWRGVTRLVPVTGDGLHFLREGHEWSATWAELGRVTVSATRWGLLQEFVVVGELAPTATKNVVWERFRPLAAGPGPAPGAAVTTIRFRNAELARAEIGRLHEALLLRAGKRYVYDAGLLAVIRGR